MTERHCIGIDIDAKYVDVAVQRWQEFAGKQATLEGDGRTFAEVKAERIVAEELKRQKWDAGTLVARRKGDPAKVVIALRLRAETTMTVAWIAERLQMGTRTHLAHLFYWQHQHK